MGKYTWYPLLLPCVNCFQEKEENQREFVFNNSGKSSINRYHGTGGEIMDERRIDETKTKNEYLQGKKKNWKARNKPEETKTKRYGLYSRWRALRRHRHTVQHARTAHIPSDESYRDYCSCSRQPGECNRRPLRCADIRYHPCDNRTHPQTVTQS